MAFKGMVEGKQKVWTPKILYGGSIRNLANRVEPPGGVFMRALPAFHETYQYFGGIY